MTSLVSRATEPHPTGGLRALENKTASRLAGIDSVIALDPFHHTTYFESEKTLVEKLGINAISGPLLTVGCWIWSTQVAVPTLC